MNLHSLWIQSKKGITIIEVMIVMLTISVGVIGSYEILFRGNNLEASTEQRIRAINYAREGIEIVENIRDTNWQRFSSDYFGCFDVLDYNPSCIGKTDAVPGTASRMSSGSYIPVQMPNKSWTLSGITAPGLPTHTGALRTIYMTQFPLMMDSTGFPIQKGTIPALFCKNDAQKNCDTKFTREIRITRGGTSLADPIKVESIVTWTGPKEIPNSITLEYTLQNWKHSFYKQ